MIVPQSEKKRGSAAVMVAVMTLLGGLTSAATQDRSVRDRHPGPKRERYLLLDARIVDDTENARLTIGTVQKYAGNPLFEEDKPWEKRFDNLYANVIFDEAERIYKCWYSPFIVDNTALGMTLEQRKQERYRAPRNREMGICYATSRDGIAWVKPELGIVEYEGSKATNILWRGSQDRQAPWRGPHGSGIFKDLRDPDPKRRYKAFLKAKILSVAFSADGIHWDPAIACPEADSAGDTHNNAFWAPTLGRYVGITRQWGNALGRQVARTSSADFIHWNKSEVVLEGLDKGHQTYAMPVFYHGGVYLGLVAIHDQEADRVWTELTWSPDTITWHRITPGTPLIPNSGKEGDYDWGCVYAAACPVFLKDEIRLYYGGSDGKHTSWRNGSFCLATLRPDGWSGYEPIDSDLPAVIRTTPVVCTGKGLRVCADVSKNGYVKIELLDSSNQPLAEGELITRTVTDGPIQWKDGFSFEKLKANKIKLRFELRQAKLYSFSFEPLECAEESSRHGFVSIFDGKTLAGWHAVPAQSTSDWTVRDGAIVGHGSADRLSYLVWKDDRLRDFELTLRYRLPGKGNTGVEIRSQPDRTGKRPFEGYHADLGHVGIGPHILGAWDFHFAERKEHPCHRGTRLVIDEDDKPHWSPIRGALTAADVRRRQWNDVRIVARGQHFQLFINGKLASECTDKSRRARLHRGALGLQIHDKGMRVEFKDIRLSRLAAAGDSQELFSGQPLWSSGTTHSGGDGIARFIDYDRDGDLDFVTSAPNPKRWVLYRNQDGRLAKQPFWESRETTDCDHIDVLDFNHDGWMDLAATHESHCTLYLNQAGKFNVTPDWETGMIANANQIDFGDFDQDGDLDMVMAGGEPVNGVALFENMTGTPARKVTRKLGHTEYSETAIYADFDDDGDLDIVAGYRAGKIVVFRNADGAFDDGTVIYEDRADPWTQRVYWRDLDDDGQSELFCAKGPWGNQLGTSLQLVKKDGALEMMIRWRSSPQTAFHGFEFEDVDNDGDTDVIAADYAHGGNLFLFLNEGGTLAAKPAWSVKTSGPAHEAVLGDIDRDGDLDLAVGCRDQAHIYENLSAKGSRRPK